MNKKKIIIVVLVGVLALTGTSLLKGLESKVDALASESLAIKSYKIPVTIKKPMLKDINDYVYSIGQVSSDDIYTVAPKIQGEITRVNFKVGDSVKKGDILFEIDSKDFLIDKNANLTQLENQLETSKLAYDDALTSYNNTKSLYEIGSSSKREFDAVKTQLENAKNNYESTQKNYNNRLNTYNASTDNYHVKSPADGIVTKVNMSVGMSVSNQNIFEIESSDRKIFNTSVSTSDINSIELGQTAKVYISTLDKTIEGEVREISYSGTNGSYPVTIELEDQDGIYTGMYGEVSIVVKEKKSALSIDEKSIMVEGEKKFIYTISENLAHKKEITTGIEDNNLVEVVSGLSKDDDVVILGKEYLSEDAEVIISEE